MGPMIAAGVWSIVLAATVPQPQQPQEPRQPAACVQARRNPFASLGHALRRIPEIEPAVSMRISAWGIQDGDGRDAEPRPRCTAPERKSLRGT